MSRTQPFPTNPGESFDDWLCRYAEEHPEAFPGLSASIIGATYGREPKRVYVGREPLDAATVARVIDLK